MRDVYLKFINAGYGVEDANECIAEMVDAIGEENTVYLCTKYDARYNRDTGCVDIISRVSPHYKVNSIQHYVGELNHYSPIGRMYSLVCDSMWSMEQILGREPIVVD